VDGEFRPILHVARGFRGIVEAVDLWQRDTGSSLYQSNPGLEAGQVVGMTGVAEDWCGQI
jgi:hypothetical protein